MTDAHTIMSYLERAAQENLPLNWDDWLRGAAKLNALLQNEDEKLAELEHRFIKVKAAYVEEGKPANQAKLLAESDDTFRDLLRQRAFVKRCNEQIMLAKKMATLTKETYMGQ